MNSVEKTPDGNFLISYRHLSAIVLVSGKTNEVLWVMGGKRNMFTDITKKKTGKDRSALFGWQHNPRLTGTNRFTFFDNHRLDNGYCWPGSGVCLRGLEVEFDPVAKTVWLLEEWPQPTGARVSITRQYTAHIGRQRAGRLGPEPRVCRVHGRRRAGHGYPARPDLDD